MIHVCFGLYDKTGRYSKFTGTAMLSMFDNHIPPPTPSITVHILHDNTLTADNRDKFSYIAGQYGQLVKFYNVEELCAANLKKIYAIFPKVADTHFSIATFYRFLIVHILPPDVNKIIYLDSDIVVNTDIAELWQIELGDKIFACIPEFFNGVNTQRNLPLCHEGYVRKEDYFNAGVLLVNLNRFRNEEALLKEGMKFIGEHSHYYCYDQDILNYCFSTQTIRLPNKFNFFVRESRMRAETKIEQKIYHYLSSSSGLGILLNMRDPFNRLWMKYFIRTPFFDVDAMGRLYDGVQQLNIGFKQSMANVSAMMSGKTRAFFVPPQSVDAVKKIFSIRDDEEIITAENQMSLKKLIDSMNASRGRKLFFIVLQGFPFGLLNQMGFVHGRDFVNGKDFLSEAHGVKFDSYPLVKAM